MASSVKPKSSTSILVSEANSSVNASENISAKYPAETHEKAGSDEVENNTRKALCVLETRTGSQTWGTLFEANSGEQILHLLIGIYPYPSQSVIAPDDLYEAVLKFSSLKTEMCIQSRDSIRHVWCTQHLKAVVVELSSEAANECRSRGANFLKVGIATVWEEVCMLFSCYNIRMYCIGNHTNFTSSMIAHITVNELKVHYGSIYFEKSLSNYEFMIYKSN